ncbi:hypothetical protein [Alicyclobacillus dauci]|uniref:Ribbon-helix-helix protein, copG family n=1 Tax=Alicyclobacillus dauci TaxID=1475485 RepID=A0ABY6YY55_9BACL|nr:hypothetical protein [Alicyclobacillus dauci]WAH35543.1 hypothetical protein NZD86_14750 [Alicyclobacillus dauci]
MARSTRRLKRLSASAELNKRIRAEAKALGLSHQEYLRLTLAISKALRESFGASGKVPPKELVMLVESPMFSMLLRGIVQTALSSVNGDSLRSETDSSSSSPDMSDEQGPSQSIPGNMAQPRVPGRHPQMNPWNTPRPVMPPRPLQQYPMPQQPVYQPPTQQQPVYRQNTQEQIQRRSVETPGLPFS